MGELGLLFSIVSEIQMTGLLELAILADELAEPLPQGLRTERERVLAGEAALQPQIAEIDAARWAPTTPFSISVTRWPRRARKKAVHAPTSPPPTIATSVVRGLMAPPPQRARPA